MFVTPWTATCQASLSFTTSWNLLKLMSIESVMPSNHLILCHPLLLLPSIFPSIRVFSNELALHIGWPKCWRFSFSISPSIEYSGLISFRINWFDFYTLLLLLLLSRFSRVRHCATPRTAAHQASLSFTTSWNLLKLMSLSWWFHPIISFSVFLFSSCLQSLPASGSFPMSWLFTSGGQSIGASASA